MSDEIVITVDDTTESVEVVVNAAPDPAIVIVQELLLTGPRGYSAYEIAVQEGFEGTEEEWLESLKGEDGTSSSEDEMILYALMF